MITEDAFQLLKQTSPFSLLNNNVLRSITKDISMEFHPKEHTILHQNGPAAEHLYVIKSGAVKVCIRTNEGEEVLVDYRTGGDFFGLLSFFCGDLSRDSVVVTEDTTCYLIKKEVVLRLLKTNAEFSERCFRSVLKSLMDMTYREIGNRTFQYGGGDKLLFTNVLSDLAVKKVITASEDVTIREAAAIMEGNRISSLVLVDHQGYPSGMITDRDLRNKVVARGRDTGGRVGDIMSVTIIKSEARDYCFEALLKMIRYNIHHLLVVGKGELKGIITSHDLMMLQGTSPLSLAREIEDQTTVDGLIPVSKKINKIISILIKEGAKASNITRIITEINDRLVKKVLEITEARLGTPPLAYCWIVYGSEGRKEQTFKTDQDNAIVYEDPDGSGSDAEGYFSEFAGRIKDALVRCGFPPCDGGYMASNPKWRQPLAVWKRYFSDWMDNPTPEAVLRSLIFFDFRPLYGDVLLAEKLRAFLGHAVKNKSIFFAHMAGIVVKNRPPLDLFGNFYGEKKGLHKGKVDIKKNGLCTITDAARLSALETGVYDTSTLARFMELKDRYGAVSEFSADLEQAFEFLLSLRLKHQFRQMHEGIEPDNFIDPGELGTMERAMLKEAFKLITSVQDAVMRKYNASMVL